MIKKAQIKQAVEAVRKLNSKFLEDATKKKNLLLSDTGGSLFLQISLKKIPNSKNVKMIKIPMPNAVPLDGVCLITGDLDKKNKKADIEPDILHYKELLRTNGITGISEVITLRQLRTEYKSYEARQLLLAAYDTFIADKKIAGVLPRVLGKHFFKKRKFPIQIDFKSEDLKRDIEYALSEKVLFLSGHGNCCSLEVAHLDMDDSKIIENVLAAVNILAEKMPGSFDNVFGLYLRLARSRAIPIYVSYNGATNVTFNSEKAVDITEDDLSTLPNACVRVYSDGRVECTRKIKDGEAEDSDGDISSAEEENTQDLKKKRKKSNKSSLPECDQKNGVKENASSQGDSKGKRAKRSKRIMEQNGAAEKTIAALSNDFEDSEVIKPPLETRKNKKSKKDNASMKKAMNTPNDSEDSQVVKSPTATKKNRKTKKETTTEQGIQFFPDDSEDSQTVNVVVETKKLKKNKKQIKSMEQAELSPKQSEDLQAVKSPKQTKKGKPSKMQAKDPEGAELLISRDPKDFKPLEPRRKSMRNPKKDINEKISENSTIEPPFNQAKKSNKRKRFNSESASAEPIKENKFEFKSPIQAPKKKKLEENVQQNLAVKKARRNKRKGNGLKSK